MGLGLGVIVRVWGLGFRMRVGFRGWGRGEG